MPTPAEKAMELLRRLVQIEDGGDYGRLCDMDGGAPGETSPYQSAALEAVMAEARALIVER